MTEDSSRSGGRAVWLRVLPMLRPYRWWIALAVLLVVGQGAAQTFSPIVLRDIIDKALPLRERGDLILRCSELLGCTVFGLVASVAQAIVLNDIGQKVVHDLRRRVYGGVRRMPLPFFATRSVGEVETRLVSDIGGISGWLTGSAQIALGASIQVIAALIVLFFFSWVLGAISVALAAAGALLNERVGRRRRAIAESSQRHTTALVNTVGEDLSHPGVLLGRTFRRHDWQSSRFERLSERIAELNRRQRVEGAGTRVVIGLAFGSFTPVLLFVAGTLTTNLSVGTVIVIATLQARLTSPIQSLISLGSSSQVTAAMLQRTFDYVDLVSDIEFDRVGGRVPREPEALSARRLSFTYPGQSHPAVRDISLDAAPTGLTLIVGQSGSGKSTLALLLSGQLRPSSGQVSVAGTAVDPEQLWRHVTLVPQETMLFNSSLRENLLFGAPDAEEPQLRQVLARVGLSEFEAQLPDGLDSPVGDDGRAVSGGERQRLGLARALLSDAPILVADEVASSVDSATAAHLHDTLVQEARQRAVILVSHRLPALLDDANVIVVEHGRVCEHGSHADLAARGGRYAELLALQSGDAPPAASSPAVRATSGPSGG